MQYLRYLLSVLILVIVGTFASAQSKTDEAKTNKAGASKLKSLSPLVVPPTASGVSRRNNSAGKPYLSVAYRLVDLSSGKLVEILQAGRKYDVLLTLAADQREGVKINPLFHTQEAKLELTDDRIKFVKEPKRNRQTVQVDAKTGEAEFTITLTDGDKLAAKDLRLKLVADLMVCDEKGSFCVKTREETLLALPSGKNVMKPLPLQFNAAEFDRVVLKVGDKAPGFTATNAEKQEIRLSDYRGKKNVILLFGRAHW